MAVLHNSGCIRNLILKLRQESYVIDSACLNLRSELLWVCEV